MPLPVVTIVGRPNVGKSTLFNRLVGGRRAIVHDEPGVTRDRLYATVEWKGRAFILGDTGGYEPGVKSGLAAQVLAQVQQAVQETALVIFVVDAREGLTPLDEEIARMLRHDVRARIVVAPNKVDRPTHETLAAEFFRMGFDEICPISAEHGLGIAELCDLIVETLPPAETAPEQKAIRVAVVGRPNVGKSSLVNGLLGQERVIVSDQPGTTRDAIDTPFTHNDTPYILIDTAGLRSRSKVQKPLERFSVARALRAIERSDVVVILLDATGEIADQDAKIAAFVQDTGCGAIVVANKWDLMPPGADAQQQFTLKVRERLRHLDYAPIAFVSALTGYHVLTLFPMLQTVAQSRAHRVPTHEINELIGDAVQKYPPPAHGKRPVRFHYATQAASLPPTFLLFVSDPRGVRVAYRRYLVNQIRAAYGFVGTPIRLVLKGKDSK
ncbi:ribosome biogenesis GTPase Der [Candidatus Methylomirabilis sp.]|uniref:ribosome biogenesis GTPase Der n=1 Tax=Candidatus Methylomirabilis sp. TaxID=2032687 RepID=UPI002A67E89F|nr:ribosome biogenesis GTPase Der [Candidatus Methylomirabilis sp.]